MLEEIVLVQLVDALTFTKWLFNFSRRKKAARCVRKMATRARIYRRFYRKLLISYNSIKIYFLKIQKNIILNDIKIKIEDHNLIKTVSITELKVFFEIFPSTVFQIEIYII